LPTRESSPTLPSASRAVPAAGDRRVAPRQPEIWKFDVRSELRQLDRLRPRNRRQLAALQDEHAIRILGEHASAGAPRPFVVAGETRDRLRPVRHDLVRAEQILAALLARHGGKTQRLPALRQDAAEHRQRCDHHRHDDEDDESRSASTHVWSPMQA